MVTRALPLAALLSLSCGLAVSKSPVPGVPEVLSLGAAVPAGGSAASNVLIIIFTGASLVRVDDAGRAHASLLERWEQREDGLVWRLTLAADARLHDDTPLTPDAVGDRITALASGRDRITPIRSRITSIKPLDDRTLEVTFEHPPGPFLESLAQLRFADDVHSKRGAGPYVLDRADDNRFWFRAFAAHAGGPPRIPRVELRIYPTPRTAWSALMRGEVQGILEVPSDAAEFIEAASTFKTYPISRPYTYMLAFNVRHPVLGRADVRRVLRDGVDRDALVRSALRGRGRPSFGPVMPGHWAYVPPSTPTLLSPAEIDQRLDEMGLRRRTEVRGLALSADRQPARFSVECLVPADLERFERVAEWLRREYGIHGIDLRLKPVPLNSLGERLAAGKFDAVLIEALGGPMLSAVTRYWYEPGGRPHLDSGYTAANAAIDALFSARDEAAIGQAARAFQRAVDDDPPAVFLAWSESARVVTDAVDVPLAEGRRDILSTIAEWSWRDRNTRR